MATTPLYNIPYPSPLDKAKDLSAKIESFALGVEAALVAAGTPPVVSSASVVAASAAARDLHWGVPSNATERLALQAVGATTIRTDTGMTERYYAGLTDGGSNPGGATPAGWHALAGDTGWITPALLNGWTAVSAAQTPKYRRLNGMTVLTGQITGGSDGSAFKVAAGFRPLQAARFTVLNGLVATAGGSIRLVVDVTGDVLAVAGSQPNLHQVTYPADQ